ncbi:MAG TPA: sigma-70 family RNA polymerase sigma factor [Blastocatellia bacterium]|nr:sigma-70 family RNA polymerase sigma factor [Blastocatellia bacterium]
MLSQTQQVIASDNGPEAWVDLHGDALFRYALLRLRDRSAAEEVVQETFLAALNSYEKFSGHSSERTWLIGILKHKITDHFRRTSRFMPLVQDERDEISSANDRVFFTTGEWVDHWHNETGPCDWNATPETALVQTEFRQRLRSCLSALPERLAAAFALREIEGLSSEEVCKVLEITSTNLWVMLHRARAQLRLCIEMHWFRQAENMTKGASGKA